MGPGLRRGLLAAVAVAGGAALTRWLDAAGLLPGVEEQEQIRTYGGLLVGACWLAVALLAGVAAAALRRRVKRDLLAFVVLVTGSQLALFVAFEAAARVAAHLDVLESFVEPPVLVGVPVEIGIALLAGALAVLVDRVLARPPRQSGRLPAWLPGLRPAPPKPAPRRTPVRSSRRTRAPPSGVPHPMTESTRGHQMRVRRAVVMGLLPLLVVAGCGKDKKKTTGTPCTGLLSPANSAVVLPTGIPSGLDSATFYAVETQGATKRYFAYVTGADMVATRDKVKAAFEAAKLTIVGTDQEPGTEADMEWTGTGTEGSVQVIPLCENHLRVRYRVGPP